MKVTPIVATVLILGCFVSANSALHVQGNSMLELPHENTISKLLTAYSSKTWGAHDRTKRSMKENIEKGFKEFSEKISKLPDTLNANLKKFFEERGISMESIQNILNDIWQAVEKLINEVKKAM